MCRRSSLLTVIGGALLIIALWSAVSLGQATITVTTTADEGGDNNGYCSLREAILAANTNSNAHESGCVAGVGASDVIVLPAGQTFFLNLGQLSITEGVTIQGNNATIDGQSLDRVFYVNSPTLVTVRDLIITRGSIADFGGCVYNETSSRLRIENSTIRECQSQGPGAGVANQGDATLIGVTIEDNVAVAGEGGCGGGVFNGNQLFVSNSLIRNNSAGLGGGLCNVAQASLEDTLAESNQSRIGGGIANFALAGVEASLQMTRGAIRQNSSRDIGGGLLNGSALENLRALARLVDVTIQGNIATHEDNFAFGGGIANLASDGGIAELELLRVTVSYNRLEAAPNLSNVQLLGAGIANSVFDPTSIARARLTNVTISGNQAFLEAGKIGVARGGGIYNGAEMTISHVTMYLNVAVDGTGIYEEEGGTTSIRSSIIAALDILRDVCQGTLESLGYNLFYPGSGCSGLAPTDLIGVDPLLGPLQNNGGLTETHELLPNSPARDYVPSSSCLDFNNNPLAEDQRTDLRPKGPGCDIGAFEARPLATITVQKRAQDLNGAPLITDDLILYTIVISNAGPGDQENHNGPEFVDPIPLGTVYVSSSAAATSGTISFNASSNQIEWDGDIPAGTSVTITFQVQVTVSPRGSGFVDLNNKNNNGLFWWFKGLFGFGCLLGGIFARRRPRLALALLVLIMPVMMSSCALAPCAPVQICNQGVFYTDDPMSRLAEVIPSDNPDTSLPNDPTCLR